jgi:hypothetical protein
MPGLVPGIHAFGVAKQGVDGRVKPGHDVEGVAVFARHCEAQPKQSRPPSAQDSGLLPLAALGVAMTAVCDQ